MTAEQTRVTEFMKAAGFKYQKNNTITGGLWLLPGIPRRNGFFITPEQATFFCRLQRAAVLEARRDAIQQVIGMANRYAPDPSYSKADFLVIEAAAIDQLLKETEGS